MSDPWWLVLWLPRSCGCPSFMTGAVALHLYVAGVAGLIWCLSALSRWIALRAFARDIERSKKGRKFSAEGEAT